MFAGTDPFGTVTFSSQSTKFVDIFRGLKDTIRLFCTTLTVPQSIKNDIIYRVSGLEAYKNTCLYFST